MPFSLTPRTANVPTGSCALPRWTVVSACALLSMLLGACGESNPQAEHAAAQASQPWLALMDEADYAQCWQLAAPLFREQESKDSWLTKAEGYRSPLGEFRSRQVNDTTYIADPWFAPPGEYAIVVYDSHWSAGTIYETVHMQRQVDGNWLVAGYSVRQQ